MAKRSPLHERSQCLNILGLSEGSSEDDIRKAYKKLALQYHPDKNHTEGAKEKFQEIGYAYKFLTEGPDAFETEDHFVPEDFLIRIFEEMFFPSYKFGFGSYFHFMFTDSDDDEYFYYNGSSDDDDDDYYGLYGARYSSSGRQYKNTFPEPNRTGHTQNLPSKKRRNKKKRNRNKDYSSTSTRQNTHSKNSEQTGFAQKNTSPSSTKSSAPKVNRDNIDAQYTDDISSVPKETDARKSTTKMDADQMQNSAESVDRPKQNDPMQQKPSKKQKRKLEAEQWRREKEMEKIAAELLEKQEKERQKQEKEQEKQAAKKQQELADADKENDTLYLFEDTKKPRRGRKNERKPTDAEIIIHTEDEDSSAASDRTTPSDISQTFTPLVPADDLCDAVPINNQFDRHNKGLCLDENHHNSQGATPVYNKGLHSNGNHQHTKGSTPVNNKGLYSSATSINKNKGLYSNGKQQHTQSATMANNKSLHSSGNQDTQGSTSVNNNNGVYSGRNHQHTQGATPVKNKGLLSSENQHTQVPTSVNNNKGVYSRGKHQHTQGATSVDNKGLYSSGNQQTQNSTSFNGYSGVYSGGNQHTQGSTSFNGNNGVYSSGNQHTQGSTSFNGNNGVYRGGNQHTQGSTSFNGNSGVYSSGNQHTQGSTSVNGNSGVYSGGNHQHTQGGTSVYNNKTQIPSDFNQPPLDSRMSDKLADFNAGSTSETKQQAKNCNQDNILPMHPGFIVTGLPSKRCGSGSSKMDHNQSFEDANFNMRSSNSQPPKTISKAAEMRGNVNNHYCSQDLFETASDKNGGKGDSSSLRGVQTHNKGGNSNEQINSWYRSIGGPAPSFAPGHMTEPYTRDVQQPEISRKYEARRDDYVQQPESRKYETKRGDYVQQSGSRKSETKRGDYVQQPESRKSETKRGDYVQQSGSRESETKRGGYVQQPESRKSETKRADYEQQREPRKSETKADGYVSHTFQTVEGSTFNGVDPYEMHVPTFRKSLDGYPFTETPHNHNQPYRQHHDQPQNQNRQKFNEFINPGTRDENFNKQTRSKDHSSKPENTRKTENLSTALKSHPRNQCNHTEKRTKIDQPAHKSLDSINDIDSEWKSGGKTATKPGYKPSSKEVDDLDSIDDIDLVYIHSDDKQNDPNKDMHTTCISNDFETKLKLSDFGNSSNDFLCRSKLDVPKSIISESIKKYYA